MNRRAVTVAAKIGGSNLKSVLSSKVAVSCCKRSSGEDLTGTMSHSLRGRKEATDVPKDWEDEYHKLRSQFDDLKIDFNEVDKLSKQ